VRIAQALADEYGKQPTRPMEVAKAVNISPTSSIFKVLSGAAVAYGITDGGSQADLISLTDLGRRIVAPTEEGDDLVARREALLRPRIVREFLQRYDSSKVPSPSIGRNVLETMGVPADSADATFDLIVDGAREEGLLTEIQSKEWVNLGAAPAPAAAEDEPDEDDDPDEGIAPRPAALVRSTRSAGEPPAPDKRPRPNAIFVGHGKNRKPLEQLKSTLDQLGIPHKEAVAEANRGRPIPQKVKETMEECGAAILIFSADDEFFDKDGESVWKPSENVVHELGAASVLYDNRIIIFKEEGVQLATNFSSIGYISFEKDKLDAKVNDLLRELISFKILKLSVGD
jgi:predicted nucleotide-binding protein